MERTQPSSGRHAWLGVGWSEEEGSSWWAPRHGFGVLVMSRRRRKEADGACGGWGSKMRGCKGRRGGPSGGFGGERLGRGPWGWLWGGVGGGPPEIEGIQLGGHWGLPAPAPPPSPGPGATLSSSPGACKGGLGRGAGPAGPGGSRPGWGPERPPQLGVRGGAAGRGARAGPGAGPRADRQTDTRTDGPTAAWGPPSPPWSRSPPQAPAALDPSLVVLAAAAMATQRGGSERRAGGCRLRP